MPAFNAESDGNDSPSRPTLDLKQHGRPLVQDRGRRAALLPTRRGRPRPAPLHARSRARRRRREARAALDPLVLAFQLKLLWLWGYLPHLGSCAECGSPGPFVGYSAKAGGTVCAGCAGETLALSSAGLAGIDGLLRRPLAEAGAVGLN